MADPHTAPSNEATNDPDVAALSPSGLSETVATVTIPPASLAASDAVVGELLVGTRAEDDRPRIRAGFAFILILLTFGASMAVVVPLSYSLTVRLAVLVPGRVDVLGWITSAGAVASIVLLPLIGVLSDRTRTRLGRRRPWAMGGAVLGTVGLLVIGTTSSIGVLVVAWMVTLVSWQAASTMVIAVLGDRLPESQRARISAFNGLANNIAPIFGIVLVTPFTQNPPVMFLLPGLVALVGVVLFACFAKDVPDASTPDLHLREVFSRMVFNPRKVKDFSWNWVGRFALFLGIAFTSTYGSYFMAARLGLPVSEIGGYVAIIGIGGVVLGILGALGVGFLSDRLHRRKVFVVLAGAILLIGTIISATSYSLPGIAIGAMLGSLGIGAFSTVDQAIVLDVIPDKTEIGRYIALMQIAQQIPTALGPVIAVGVLSIGASQAAPNYTLLFVTSGVLALVGALVILFRVRAVR